MEQKKKRRRYDAEFKKNVVGLMASGRSAASLAESFGVSTAQIYNWKSKYGTTQGQQNEKQAIKDLEAKLREVTEERDILKKAMAYMSQGGLK